MCIYCPSKLLFTGRKETLSKSTHRASVSPSPLVPQEGHEILALGSDEAELASGPLLVQATWPWVSSGMSASFSCFIHKVQKSDQCQVQSKDRGEVGKWTAGCVAPLRAWSLAHGSLKNSPCFQQMGTFLCFLSMSCLYFTTQIQSNKSTFLGYWPSQGHI